MSDLFIVFEHTSLKYLSFNSIKMWNFVFLTLFLSVFRIQAAPLYEQNTEAVLSNNIEDNGKSHLIDLSFYGKHLYGQPDLERTGNLVANYSQSSANGNPEELGSYLEGDMLVPARGAEGRAYTRNGVTSQSSRWPNGVVPFEIRGSFTSRDLSIIEQALEQYHKRTCIRFIPRTTQKDYVSIISERSGCWSSVGRIGGKQEVNLQSPGCLTKLGTAIHELMHALGFLHEQNRHERDSYVSIQFQNVQSSALSNFDRVKDTDGFGVPYDYGSVMHYSANAFSTNGRTTIVALQPGGSERMGQRDGFSNSDVQKINKMYKCRIGAGNVAQPTATTATNNNNNVVNSFLGGLINGLGLQG